MKTIRTIATAMLAAFMVLGPAAAFAAGATMTISTNSQNYSGTQPITISGTITPAPTIPSNVVITTTGPMGAVDINSVPVTVGTGSFSYSFTAGGSAGWVSGSYTVNGTWGASGNTATQTTTFNYLSQQGGGQVITITSTTTVTTTVAQATVTTTTTVPSSDAAALSSIQSSLTDIQSSLSSLTSAVNTISSGITAIQSSITSSTSGLGALANVPSQLTTLTNAVNNNQTYVLVVAALAAITLVLELAILVRKLS